MESEQAKTRFKEADALFREHRYGEALTLLNELDGEFPNSRNVLYPQALCLLALGKAAEALEVCGRLETLFGDPRVPKLRSRIQAKQTRVVAQTIASDPLEGLAPASRPARSNTSAFPMRAVVVCVVVLGLAALGALLYLKPTSEKSKEVAPSEAAVAQTRIDEAIRESMTRRVSPPFTYLYDTGSAAEAPLSETDIDAQAGWVQVSPEQAAHTFNGDAVLLNDRLVLVLRRQSGSAEVYARGERGARLYAELVLEGRSMARLLESVTVVQNGEDAVIIDASFRAQDSSRLGVRYELTMGQVFVKAEPTEGTARLHVQAPCRFVVLPDFFADDIVIDAKEIAVDHAELPSENFLLQMLDDGKAIVMEVWENRDQEVRIALGGTGDARTIASSDIAFGEGGSVWVAVLAAEGVWHVRDILGGDGGKELALNWQWPYPALWRVDWRRTDALTDSWEMLTENQHRGFQKHGLFEEKEDEWTAQDWWGSGQRTRIASGLGRFKYPCWVDKDGMGWLQPLAKDSSSSLSVPEFRGPAILYPLNRLKATPLDKFTVVDVVRSCLGVGPCAYILDLEGQGEAFAGRPTCTIEDVLDDIYEKGQQGQRVSEVEKALEDVLAFITLIRNRIDDYATFAKDMQAYLDEQGKTHPELRESISQIAKHVESINYAVAFRRERIKSIEYAANLTEEFRKDLVDYTGADAAQKCKEFTSAWVDIGGNQDTLVAECRSAVKLMRQRSGMAVASNPKFAEVGEEIRARTQTILRDPVNYESPRH